MIIKNPEPLKARKLSAVRLIAYVGRNPGLTATQYGRLLGKRYGTISSRLFKLSEVESRLERKLERGATQDRITASRYYLRTAWSGYNI